MKISQWQLHPHDIYMDFSGNAAFWCHKSKRLYISSLKAITKNSRTPY